jgi:hypothetical protein
MAGEFTRVGYGQLEPNHLSAQRTGQIYAQLPAKSDINVLEQGMFVKYNYAAGVCDFAGAGEWMLVYNEEKLYDERKQFHKDFALVKTDFVDGEMTPRVYKTNVGDILTTNTLDEAIAALKTDIAAGTVTKLVVNTNGKLTKEPASPVTGAMTWQIVDKAATMPDGQAAVKIMRIQ